jgi:hypothetical protein
MQFYYAACLKFEVLRQIKIDTMFINISEEPVIPFVNTQDPYRTKSHGVPRQNITVPVAIEAYIQKNYPNDSRQ